jgi:hypothetical protein
MSYKKITCDGREFNLVLIEEGNLKIVVLDKGFVYVGNFTDNGDTIRIDNARCCRVWGTTKGLAQLANEGPNGNTKLDDATTVIAPKHALIHTLDCVESKWNK